MAGPTSGEGLWEVQDAGVPAVQAPTSEVRRWIFERRFGLGAQGRHASGGTWLALSQYPEFAHAFPQLGFRAQGTPNSAAGRALVSGYLPRLNTICETALKKPEFRAMPFFFPGYVPSAPLIERNTHLYRMWEGFYVGLLIESVFLKPGEPLRLYVFAVNLSASAQTRRVSTSGLALGPGQDAALDFALPPWCWDVRAIVGYGRTQPGEDQVSFRTASSGHRLAKGAAVTALTLGMVIYKPGFKGFTLRYQVLQPNVGQAVTDHQAAFAAAATGLFEQQGARFLRTEDGMQIPRDAVLQGFGRYLTTERVSNAFRAINEQTKAADVGLRLFGHFAQVEFGASVPGSLVGP